MSRVAKKPISLPASVEVSIDGLKVAVKGKNTTLHHILHRSVAVSLYNNELTFTQRNSGANEWAQVGTARSIINNMVVGVSEGFQKKLLLNGVGYRAQAKGSVLNLTLGFSHPVQHAIPDGISVETPTQTEIVLKGADKQLIGQVASEIRAYRPPEPYKGKGVRYADENVRRKEAKKK
ncbi:MAG: 50S ribosomal protein L6 [Pseudomonadales bacterium]|nr:50S ribosomal protein L6 [Pseudomonadales bacterium]